MFPASALMARTDRHFSETGIAFTFSLVAFDWVAIILPHFLAFVNELF